MANKYQYTSQKQLRKAFWQCVCDECGIDYTGKKTKFDLDLNMTFNNWIDGLQKDGEISSNLRDRATLY